MGKDEEQIKNGYSMIIATLGDILEECRSYEDCISTATIIPEKLLKSGGYRYINARRPELYKNILGKEHLSNQQVAWLNNKS